MAKISEKEVLSTLEIVQEAFEKLKADPELMEKTSFEFENFTNSMYMNRSFNPWAQIDLMKNQNLNVQTPASDKDINEALANPTANENKLIGYVQGYYFSSLMFKRNHEYIVNLPAFDLEPRCTNAEKKDLNTKQYKADRAAVKKFLAQFDFKNEFRKALWGMLMEETYYCFFREFETKSTLQPWPFKYAQISGRFEYGLLFDIDMTYFLQPYVDFDCYPDWLKTKYKDIFGDGKGHVGDYKPGAAMNKRTGKFATWVQTSPEDGAFAFKFTDKHNAQIPFFSGMLPEMAMLPLLRKLQENQAIGAARKLLVSSVPYLNEKKSSSVVNQIAISPELLGKFLALATQGLENVIKVLALPTEDIKGVEFKNTDPDTYSRFIEVTSGILGGGKVIFAPSTRMTAMQTQLALDLDRQLATSVYSQFEEFLNYYANRKTKKYKWKFTLVGTQDWLNKEARTKEVFTYADKGIVLPTKIASSLGMTVFELEDELDTLDDSGFIEKLRMIPNVNTSSGFIVGTDGRPQVDDSQLSEGGQATRDNGSNLDRGGTV